MQIPKLDPSDMNKIELDALMQYLDFHPGKALGQNFLIDGNLLEFIVRTAAPKPGEIILEAGPGFGVLTRALLATGAKVRAIEFDRRLAAYLRENIDNPNFQLVEGDACKVPLEPLIPTEHSFRSIANLPYAVSSVFIARLIDLPKPPVQMLFMLQKEMGQRLAAKFGTKNYGALSVRTQLLYKTKILRTVPKQVFHPQPEVDSALVLFELLPELPTLELRNKVSQIVRTVFAQRRKMIHKPLSALLTPEKALEALEKAGIDPTFRPDNISVADYLKLAEIL